MCAPQNKVLGFVLRWLVLTSLDSLTSLCSFLWSLFLEVTPFLRWGLFPVLIAWTHKDYLCLNSSCICIRQSLFVALPCKLLALATWCKEPTYWKRPWCWERLRAGEEGGDRGWDDWLATSTQWTWVEQTPGDSEKQGSLVCCSLWGHKELDATEWLNNKNKALNRLNFP